MNPSGCLQCRLLAQPRSPSEWRTQYLEPDGHERGAPPASALKFGMNGSASSSSKCDHAVMATMSSRLFRPLLLCLAFVALSGAARAQSADAFTPQFRKFADAHCIECHGPDVQKSKLRLDTLTTKFDDKDISATWVKVLDKLAKALMPPPKSARPPAKELGAVTTELNRHLLTASLARQQQDGRVVLRRLNRTEYQTALRDLLGGAVDVKDLLPEDNTAAGFDNVSAVLDISSTHLLRYQDAAERALQTVIPSRPPVPFAERRTGRQISEKVKSYKDLPGKSVQVDGDALIMHVRPWAHVPCATPAVQQAGRYRVRASVYAVGTGGQPLPMISVAGMEWGRDDKDVRAVRDVPADKPTVIEGEFELKPRQVIAFFGMGLPSPRDFEAKQKGQALDPFTGPGLVVQWVEIEGPLDVWPPEGYVRLFGDVPLKPKSVAKAEAEGRPAPANAKRSEGQWIYDPLVVASTRPREDAERLMHTFLPQAFRRPVGAELERYYVQQAHAALDKGLPFSEAMLLGYKVALCSPHFLFLTEPITTTPGRRGNLDDYAVAARLAAFLWSSVPDTELMQLAAKGELTQPTVLRAQVERLLKDAKGRRFTQNFAGQWLDLRKINATSPDPQTYGEFDDFLFWSMPRETEMFFDEVLSADRSVTDFVHSDWTFLNQRLARHYGIAGVAGGELRKVSLSPGSHRGGVLTHASILKVTADGTRTSPVLRGTWVLDHMLGQPPAPPPPDAGSIEPDIRGATTIRQQLDKHRNTAACAACHQHIDPPGFALESFDVIGGWRDFYRGTRATKAGLVELANYPGRKVYRGPDVEQGGQTHDGRPFKDIDDYKQLLLADKDQLARNVAEKLLVYATGADIQFADREVVEQLVAKAREKNYGFRSLLHEVVQSRIFLNK